MGRLGFIYMVSLLLLWNIHDRYSSVLMRPFFKKKNTAQMAIKRFLNSRISDPLVLKMSNAYIAGDKSQVPAMIRRWHYDLGVVHMMTPSGLHLASLGFYFWPLIALFRRFGLNFYLLFYLGLQTVPDFFSLKRMALFKGAMHLSFVRTKNINPYFVFLGLFFIDFWWGTYRENPLSFTYSFLFLGTLLSLYLKGIRLLLSIWGAFIVASFFNGQHWGALFPVFNFICGVLFTLYFPTLVFLILIGWCDAQEWATQSFLAVIKALYQANELFFSFHSNPLIVMTVIVLATIKLNKTLKMGAVLFCLATYSPIASNLRMKRDKWYFREKRVVTPLPPVQLIKKIEYRSYGQLVTHQNGVSCKIIRTYFWPHFRCRAPKRSKKRSF